MSAITSIEWTDRTWNPVRGCSVVSPGCVNCYAMKFAHRFSGKGKPYEGLTKQTKAGPQWNGQVRLVEDALIEPLRWKKPARVFVNSMSDLFHESVPDVWIDRIFHTMQQASHLTFQVLTKRSDRMREYSEAMGRLTAKERGARIVTAQGFKTEPSQVSGEGFPWPLSNVWLGFSAEDQPRFDERWAKASPLAASGWTIFASLEPLIAPIVLPQQQLEFTPAGSPFWPPPAQPKGPLALPHKSWPDDFGYWQARGNGLSWVIVGGESGPGARPCDVAWIRSIVQQCQSGAVPVFAKQLGSVPVMDEDEWRSTWPTHLLKASHDKHAPYGSGLVPLALNNRKGGDPAEWPEDLRVREFPATEARP